MERKWNNRWKVERIAAELGAKVQVECKLNSNCASQTVYKEQVQEERQMAQSFLSRV